MEEIEGPTLFALLYFSGEWIIRLIMLVVVPFRRTPDAAKGWLLLILFLPWVGLVLYLMIGSNRLPRWRAERFARLPEVLATVRRQLLRQVRDVPSSPPESLLPAARLAARLAHFQPLGGNAVELLTDYDDAIGRLIADIDGAREHVHLLYYIFADDAVGHRVIDALGRAVARGVECRVLADAYGSRPYLRRTLARLRERGVEAWPALPVKWWNLYGPRMDLRNHRKVAVIDGRCGYIGSQNLVDAGFKPGLVYEELVVRVAGPVVLQLQGVFVADWYLETDVLLGESVFAASDTPGERVVQSLPSGPDFPIQNNQRLLVDLLHQARSRVVITTPYFIPDQALLQALETAVLRGVDVHLVLAVQMDQWLVGLAQRSYYDELLEMGVHIHHYRKAFLHAKHMSWDDSLALIGSSNVDIRSFALNAEISLLFYGPEVPLELRRIQERYFADTEKVDYGQWRNRPLAIKTVQNLARMLSPLL